MIVYVESNFVLELAFLQEETHACGEVLDLAESGRIRLVFPGFCVAEPYSALRAVAKRRATLQTDLQREITELERARPYQDLLQGSSEIVALLGRSADESQHRLEEALQRILGSAEVVQVDVDLYAESLELQKTRSLGPQDAVVYASILRHLRHANGERKCFLNRNSKDFVQPDIVADLEVHDCRLIPSFADGLGYIAAQLEE